ncbi:MAG TPA: ornithine cyclodeaminase family protein [Streptosporangiaceae bacterium]|nr:ornithine cyclodeaminase family protein [Streptosporangiaceae bacterium]
MSLLVLSADDVHEALSPADCVQAMRSALTALAAGQAQQPLRTVTQPAGAAGLVALMPSFTASPRPRYGLKALCITPANPAAGLDAHQGVVLLSAGETGEPLALLNASAVTEIRTAAVSVLATELLALQDARVLAVIGTGVQARAHIRAFDQARELTAIRVAGRDLARAEQYAAGAPTRAPVMACAGAEEAVADADIIVTATSSAIPVLRREWIKSGAHINAVGACLPHARELDTDTVAQGALFADRRDSVLAESGDYVLAAADGVIGPDHIRADVGELLLGTGAGRGDAKEITIFESLGLAVEDLAAAERAYQTAVAAGTIGSWVNF